MPAAAAPVWLARRAALLCALLLAVPALAAAQAPVRIQERESDVVDIANVEILNEYSEVAATESEPARLVVVNHRVRFLLRCKAPGRVAIRMIRYSTGQGDPSYAQTRPVTCTEAGGIKDLEFQKESWHSWRDAVFWLIDK